MHRIMCYRGKEILIGYEAANQAEHNPENTIYDAKRFIGKSFSSEELREEALRYPFKVHNITMVVKFECLPLQFYFLQPTEYYTFSPYS